MGMVGAVVALCGMWCCRGPEGRGLETALHAILADAPAQVGVAVIIDGKDTVVVNNDVRYPLMSVFKLHQAIAVCGALDASSRDLDLIMPVASEDLDRNTWSPLAESCPEGNDSLTVGEMMDYLLRFSDNNVSNILFDRMPTTDSVIATGVRRWLVRCWSTECLPILWYRRKSRLISDSVWKNATRVGSVLPPHSQARRGWCLPTVPAPDM